MRQAKDFILSNRFFGIIEIINEKYTVNFNYIQNMKGKR